MGDDTTDGSTLGIMYGRVSTGEQADSGLGLEAQRTRCEAHCTITGIAPVEWAADEGVSGSMPPYERPVLGGVLARLAAGEAAALVVSSLDRLARSTLDVLTVADLAAAQGWRLVIVGLVDSGTPEGRAVVTVMAAMAQLERDLIRRRTRDALAALRHRGARLGRPVSEATRAAGRRVVELRRDGRTWADCADVMTAEAWPRATTAARPAWTVSACRTALRSVTLDDEAAQRAAAP